MQKKRLYPFKFSSDTTLLNGDSIIENGFLAENSLDDIIETYLADLLGQKVLEYYRGELPITVKIIELDNAKLPIMACPDDQTARERYLVWGRPFLWYVCSTGPNARLYYGFNRQMTPTSLYNAVLDGTAREKMYSFTPHPKDSLYVRGGMPFSAEGTLKIIEISQNSPITYHLEEIQELGEAMDILDYSPVTEENNVQPHSSFVVNMRTLTSEAKVIPTTFESFIIYICTEGEAVIKLPDSTTYPIATGEMLFIPESMEDFTIAPVNGTEASIMEIYMNKIEEPGEEEDSYLTDHVHGHDNDCDCTHHHHDHDCGHHHNH